MKLSGAQIVVKMLEKQGIKIVAGIPGGSILPLYDELNKSSIRHILVRQEQAAGFIAQGMARTSGKAAVCMATSGPGAMNLLTAIADARSDSVPLVAITGQVNSSLIGTDAFQEADTFGLSFPITKHSMAVKKPEELLTAIPQAFAIAQEGRPGPVLIDIPRDVQLALCEVKDFPDYEDFCIKEDMVRFHTSREKMQETIEKMADCLLQAEKPVLYLGGGCNSQEASFALRAFKEVFRLPVVTSLMALGVFEKDDPDNAGMVGMHGSYPANAAMHESDLVLAVGVRFDDRATGVTGKFCPSAKILHIDIDAAEINKILPSALSLVCKAETALPLLTKAVKTGLEKASGQREVTGLGGGTGQGDFSHAAENRNLWAEKIAGLCRENFSFECGCPVKGEKTSGFEGSQNPRKFLSELPSLAQKAGILEQNILVTTDVGQHQMFAAQYYPVKRPRSFLTSGSLGTMGFGLPAAIGAALQNPDKRVVCISGDGSILMNIQELATLAENNLAVTVIVFVNRTLGMVYQQQKFLFDKNYSASNFASEPDLLKIAEGFGIEGADADSDKEWYKKAFDPNRKNKPFFVTVKIDPEENVLPFVPGGKANIEAIR
ncbi:thiamine pyrophosphate-dependent enzyme [Treponema berlinense]|uniref:thiamine pyrophosphate-dependent enzyme n=1 Tax=Treponema berlinense TaxID=225004 RepID=UPI0026EAF6F7|nr:thiamine pyrophosphate-dependent enzyme [Treponema berlinense]